MILEYLDTFAFMKQHRLKKWAGLYIIIIHIKYLAYKWTNFVESSLTTLLLVFLVNLLKYHVLSIRCLVYIICDVHFTNND